MAKKKSEKEFKCNAKSLLPDIKKLGTIDYKKLAKKILLEQEKHKKEIIKKTREQEQKNVKKTKFCSCGKKGQHDDVFIKCAVCKKRFLRSHSHVHGITLPCMSSYIDKTSHYGNVLACYSEQNFLDFDVCKKCAKDIRKIVNKHNEDIRQNIDVIKAYVKLVNKEFQKRFSQQRKIIVSMNKSIKELRKTKSSSTKEVKEQVKNNTHKLSKQTKEDKKSLQ